MPTPKPAPARQPPAVSFASEQAATPKAATPKAATPKAAALSPGYTISVSLSGAAPPAGGAGDPQAFLVELNEALATELSACQKDLATERKKREVLEKALQEAREELANLQTLIADAEHLWSEAADPEEADLDELAHAATFVATEERVRRKMVPPPYAMLAPAPVEDDWHAGGVSIPSTAARLDSMYLAGSPPQFGYSPYFTSATDPTLGTPARLFDDDDDEDGQSSIDSADGWRSD